MRIVQPQEWEGSKQDLLARVDAFKAAKQAHALTVGEPAPIEEQIVEELAKRDPAEIVLAADLPIEPPPDAARPELDQVLADRWILNRLAKQLASDKDAPDYLVRHAGRLP